MTREHPRRDRIVACELTAIERPRFEDVIDVVIEREETVLHGA
jgi:hypothetical protein